MRFRPLPLLFAGLCGLLAACQEKGADAGREGASASKEDAKPAADALVAQVTLSEEVIEILTPKLFRIARSIRNMQLPDYQSRPLFASDATCNTLGAPTRSDSAGPLSVREVSYAVVADGSLEAGLWKPLFARAEFIDDASLGVLAGRFPDNGDREAFEMLLTFGGRARVADGWESFGAKIETRWRKAGDDWLIAKWTVKDFTGAYTPALFFEEILDAAVPDPKQRARARFSIHEDLVTDMFLGKPTTLPYPERITKYFTAWDSLEQHPGVSVVDLDHDGWDDLYVMARWGPNQFWRNRGDGTFEEIAASLGLDIDGMCNAAVFADFDNDGDFDCVIGRSAERSLYLRNDNGRFTDVSTELVEVALPYAVSSVAAVDYNLDGLLDVYFSGYYLPASKVPIELWSPELIEPHHLPTWQRRLSQDHPIFRQTGPPNLLLVNRGNGTFQEAPENEDVMLWLNSFQSTWSDYDQDGDPDLFVANDYGPDIIVRHDGVGPDGTVTFTDVTAELAGDELQQFGMGVSLGDYDADGHQDAYFTYMFSKAGSRITAQFPQLTERSRQLAQGNKLFRQVDGKFVKVSGLEPPSLLVAKTGWSWGGQFGDFDNDAYLDLYVPTGYYTAPPAIATEVDL